ncbi:FecR family protein [Cesiribacter sp. SM1]|uniref:FecR family protein n=1 Tax=Cesiribacter sp. SM1 TaxID=2861196 RepID=UPI001CD6F157|nr:FecR domain-containing protein [Cesiribacter sp. SM1]
METDPQYISLLHKELTHQLRPEEAEMLKVWLAENEQHRQLREEIRMSWALTTSTAPPETGEDEIAAELKRLKQRIHQVPEQTSRVSPFRWQIFYKLVGIVLLLALAAGGWILFRNTDEQAVVVSYEHPAGEQAVQVYMLPDSTKVFARQGTTLSYQFADQKRSVYLSGQAYFQVTRDEHHPFQIDMEGMRVKVLGTSFFVKAVSGEPLEVSVASGSVEVQYYGQYYRLGKDDLLRVFPEEDPRLEKNVDPNYLSWQHGKLVFRQSPFHEVLPALERHYGAVMDVENPQLLNCRFTGSFQDPALEELMEIFSYSLGVSVEKQENGQLLIRGGSCQGQGVK